MNYLTNLINRYEKMPIQAKASIWYTVCSFFQKGISFIVVPIYVRLLTTEEYGDWSVFQSWASILIIFASLNLYAGVYTKTLVDLREQKERDVYTSSMQGLGTLITIMLLIVYAISYKWSAEMLKMDKLALLILFFYFIFHPAVLFWSTRQRVENRYKSMVMVTVGMTVLTPLVSLLLLHYTELRLMALILGYFGTQCVFGAFFYILHMYRGKTFFNKRYWEYAMKFNVPLIPHYLSLIVLGQSDRIMIGHFCGNSDAGIYSFAYQIATVMNVFLSAVNGARVPWSYEQLRDRSYKRLRAVSNTLCLLMGLITLSASILAPDIIRILGTADYMRAKYVIPIVALGVYYTFIYDMFCTVEFYYGATQFVMIASVIGAISNIAMNALMIPKYGFISAAYTTLISYIIFVLMHYYFMHKVMRQQNIKEEIYDLRTTLRFSMLLNIFVVVSMLTYNSTLARYSLLVCLLIATALMKNRIITGLKTINDKDR